MPTLGYPRPRHRLCRQQVPFQQRHPAEMISKRPRGDQASHPRSQHHRMLTPLNPSRRSAHLPILPTLGRRCAQDGRLPDGPLLRRTGGADAAEPIFGAVDELTRLALKTGQIQLGLLFSSDPGIQAFGLTVLADDKHLQDIDVVVPVVQHRAVSPRLTAALNRLTTVLTTSDLMRLNAAADLNHTDPADVAHAYMRSKGLAASR